MTGQEPIIAMRRAGRAPRFVWVQDFPGAIYGAMNVRLAPADVPEQLDFRFLVGLTALVEGFDHARVERIATACARFAKRVVANVNSPVSVVQAYGGPTFPVVKTTDTEGVVTWQD